ncbi:MAG: low molecular weight phosphatase family protein [Bacteroidota bacterium]
MSEQKGKILFICTGNYYRSRFAEIVFNKLAEEQSLGMTAISRGFTPQSPNNPGPISPYAIQELKKRGIVLNGETRFPMLLEETHLQEADLTIAMKGPEHRPMMAQRFPRWADRITYWHIHDIQDAHPYEAMALLENQVIELVEQLANQAD